MLNILLILLVAAPGYALAAFTIYLYNVRVAELTAELTNTLSSLRHRTVAAKARLMTPTVTYLPLGYPARNEVTDEGNADADGGRDVCL